MEWTRELIDAEIAEKTADFKAFSDARAIIRARVIEVQDSKCQLTPLANWSGTDAVLGSLDLAVHAIERTLLELNELRKAHPPKPILTVVREPNP